MSIFVDKNTRLLVQGITGREGRFHMSQCKAYGTNVVAGVTPGKGGELIEDVPVFNTVKDAVKDTGANCTMIFVPPHLASDAIMEAASEGVDLIVAITEGIPIHDMIKVKAMLNRGKVRLIGPNCPGVITPGEAKVGIIPWHHDDPKGNIGVVSRSGTLTYEVVHQLTERGIGQSTCVGIGGDPINGTSFTECLEAFENDPETEGVVMIGEIGGNAEEAASKYIKQSMKKPVVGYVAGVTAPPGRRMGHAGAIISGGAGTAAQKIKAMEENGVHVCRDLGSIGELCEKVFK